jgi:hypothetical protein
MILLGLGFAVASVLAAEEFANRRGQLGHAATTIATTSAGLVVIGALGYGLAAEGWRLAGAVRSAAAEHLPGA